MQVPDTDLPRTRIQLIEVQEFHLGSDVARHYTCVCPKHGNVVHFVINLDTFMECGDVQTAIGVAAQTALDEHCSGCRFDQQMKASRWPEDAEL